jgi:flagellar L-ring protein precursor FlgH
MIKPAVAVAVLIALAAPAGADTLYVSAPPAAAPGHPLRLGTDHRAQQVGDLVQIVFNFATNTNSSGADTTANTYTSALNAGTGLFNLPLIRTGGSLGSSRTNAANKSQVAVQSFTSSMTAVVTNVLPSGALEVAGDQKLNVNGVQQNLHVTGTMRQEDIDFTDSVLSSRVANIDAHFTGIGSTEKQKGVLQKIIGFLFG